MAAGTPARLHARHRPPAVATTVASRHRPSAAVGSDDDPPRGTPSAPQTEGGLTMTHGPNLIRRAAGARPKPLRCRLPRLSQHARAWTAAATAVAGVAGV